MIDQNQINPFLVHEHAPVRVGVLGCPEAREREQLWWSASMGKRIRLREMSLAHIINSLRMIVRDAGWGGRDPASQDEIVQRRSGGRALLEEWRLRTLPHTPHWSLGHVPLERDWWEKRRLHSLPGGREEIP